MPPMTTESLPAPAPTWRQELIDRLAEPCRYDLAVIGGGATGLGVALDAAARGFSVVLVESHDFAKGTSSRATKLVHGGVRYLARSEEHTSELQSQSNLVCRLLLEKKKRKV